MASLSARGARIDHVDLAAAQRVCDVFRRQEAIDDPVEVGAMRSPVAGVSYERDLPATIPGPDEEGAAPDRLSRLGVVDPVAATHS